MVGLIKNIIIGIVYAVFFVATLYILVNLIVYIAPPIKVVIVGVNI